MFFFRGVVSILLLVKLANAYAQDYEKIISPLHFAGVHSLESEQGHADGYIVIHSASEGVDKSIRKREIPLGGSGFWWQELPACIATGSFRV